MFRFTSKEIRLFRKLKTPRQIQAFITKIPINFEEEGETCYSPRLVLKHNKAHCIEGALLAAAILRLHGHPPLIVDLEATKDDYDHVICVFKQHGCWGAISKTNHAVLRYRDPVYKSIRELVMSYFHEYFDDKGRKNLRSYTNPINLAHFDQKNWMTAEEEVWYIAEHLADAGHILLMNRKQITVLKKPDKVEIKAGNLVEWKKPSISHK